MSQETRERYEKDLLEFYTVFTGNAKPSNITNFQQIRLKDYAKEEEEKVEEEGKRERRDRGKEANVSWFVFYAEDLRDEIQCVVQDRKELTKKIEHIFFSKSKEKMKIRKSLTYPKLQEYVVDCRRIITHLFIHCEDGYERNLQIQEAVIESILIDTLPNQIAYLTLQKAKIKEHKKAKKRNRKIYKKMKKLT